MPCPDIEAIAAAFSSANIHYKMVRQERYRSIHAPFQGAHGNKYTVQFISADGKDVLYIRVYALIHTGHIPLDLLLRRINEAHDRYDSFARLWVDEDGDVNISAQILPGVIDIGATALDALHRIARFADDSYLVLISNPYPCC